MLIQVMKVYFIKYANLFNTNGFSIYNNTLYIITSKSSTSIVNKITSALIGFNHFKILTFKNS